MRGALPCAPFFLRMSPSVAARQAAALATCRLQGVLARQCATACTDVVEQLAAA